MSHPKSDLYWNNPSYYVSVDDYMSSMKTNKEHDSTNDGDGDNSLVSEIQHPSKLSDNISGNSSQDINTGQSSSKTCASDIETKKNSKEPFSLFSLPYISSECSNFDNTNATESKVGYIKPIQRNPLNPTETLLDNAGNNMNQIKCNYQLSIKTTSLNPSASIFSPKSYSPSVTDISSHYNHLQSRIWKPNPYGDSQTTKINNVTTQTTTNPLSTNITHTSDYPSISSNSTNSQSSGCTTSSMNDPITMYQRKNNCSDNIHSYWTRNNTSLHHSSHRVTPLNKAVDTYPPCTINNSTKSSFHLYSPLQTPAFPTYSSCNAMPLESNPMIINSSNQEEPYYLYSQHSTQPNNIKIPCYNPMFNNDCSNSYNISSYNKTSPYLLNDQLNPTCNFSNKNTTYQQFPCRQSSPIIPSVPTNQTCNCNSNSSKETHELSTRMKQHPSRSNQFQKESELSKDKFQCMGIFDKNDLEVVKTNYKAQFSINHPNVDVNRTNTYSTQCISNSFSSGQNKLSDTPSDIHNKFLTSVWTNKSEQKKRSFGRNQRIVSFIITEI